MSSGPLAPSPGSLPSPARSIREGFAEGRTGRVRPSVTAYRDLIRAIRPHAVDIVRAMAQQSDFDNCGNLILHIPRSEDYKDIGIAENQITVKVIYNNRSGEWVSDTAHGWGIERLFIHISRIRGRPNVDGAHDLYAHIGRAAVSQSRGSKK